MVENSLLQPVLSEGRLAMLKVPLNKEEQRGFRLLACWEGRAAVNVFRYDAHALLMERAIGERSLKQMVFSGKEEEPNRIICTVVEQLHGECLSEPAGYWFHCRSTGSVRAGIGGRGARVDFLRGG